MSEAPHGTGRGATGGASHGSSLSLSGNLRREARIIGLLFASMSSVVGSGWLFGSFHAAKIAGPLAIWSWIVGGIIIMLIALTFAELASMFPRSGALVHMSHASHGDGLGRIWAWMLFLCYVPVPPVEAEAVVTYAQNYLPYFIQPHSGGLLNATGFAVCAVLLGIFAVLNLLAVRLLLDTNTIITWWKLLVPAITVIGLVAASTHWGVMAADPGGYRVTGIFTALPAAGIVFSYLGFRTAIDLGGESANPHRDIPLAVIGSVLLSIILYIGLQSAFLLALRPGDLAHGWANLSFTGQLGPFAGLATVLGLGWLAALLYIDAYISPGGTGLIYVTGGARILYGVGDMRAGPRWLMLLNRARAPWASVALIWVVGVLFLLPFPAWQLMVNYITSTTVLSYGLGPVALLVMRRNVPGMYRPFRLWGANVLAPLAFICSNLIIEWSGFKTNSFLFGLVTVGFVCYALYYHLVARRSAADFGWSNIAWLFLWFGGMWMLSALAGIGGGYHVIGFWEAVVLVALWSLVVMYVAVRTALTPRETEEIMARMDERPQPGV